MSNLEQELQGAVKRTVHMSERGARTVLNRIYRKHDESHLWPIRGKFNVTERAIRQVRALEREIGPVDDYCAELESAMSRIVNNERNW